MTTILVILLLVAFATGAELFAVMLGAAAVGAMTLPRGFAEFDGMVTTMFGVGSGEQATVLSTIPMFIYVGYLLAEARTADRLVRFANAALGWMPGGLAIVTILTCALFTTFTGASGVTIVALGGVLMPALVRNGYPERFSMGLLAGTGAVGLLFPPALPLFIYGTVFGLTQVGDPVGAADWDTRRFIFAGIVPGIVVVALLSFVAIWVARKLPRQKFEARELGRSFLAALPELAIPFGVILGLASGFGLPEIASLTVVYVVVLELAVLRMIKPIVLWSVTREAMAMIGAIFIIILASTTFTNYLVTAEIPTKLVEVTQQYVESKIVFLLVLNVLLLLIGMFMDIFSAIVIVLPLITPIAKHYGIDPYHLGVIFLLNLEVGYLTPPVGINLFMTAMKFQRPVVEVMRATIPFMLTLLVALMIVTYLPALTIVPEAERTAPISTLHSIVATGIEESKVKKPTITLVDAAGNELKGRDGKPIVRKFVDCAAIDDATKKDNCQALFFDVTDCSQSDPPEEVGPNDRDRDGVADDDDKCPDAAETRNKFEDGDGCPDVAACEHAAIANWIAKELNGDVNDLEKAVVVVAEVALVDADGAPLTAGEGGAQIVKKLAACDPLTGTDRETCRALFVEVSSCHIKHHDLGECLAERTKECPADTTYEACVTQHAPACRAAAVEACAKDKIQTWVDEFPAAAQP